MSEKTGPSGAQWGVLLFGAALAAAAAAIGYRALDDGGSANDAELAQAGPASIEELERRAGEAGDDPRPWQELAFARFDRGEFDKAAEAYRAAIAIDDGQAVLWSALGETLVMASKRDPLPRDALAAFRKAVALDANDPRGRYFLAVKRDLDGDHEGAITDWLALLAITPPGAPWEADLARTIEQVGKINGIDTSARLASVRETQQSLAPAAPAASVLSAGNAIPGPDAGQIAAAGAIPPGEQRQMAEGMVASLEGKLASDPANIEGWIMLMRSRQVLGQPDRARKALNDALAANPQAATRLRNEAEVLGLR